MSWYRSITHHSASWPGSRMRMAFFTSVVVWKSRNAMTSLSLKIIPMVSLLSGDWHPYGRFEHSDIPEFSLVPLTHRIICGRLDMVSREIGVFSENISLSPSYFIKEDNFPQKASGFILMLQEGVFMSIWVVMEWSSDSKEFTPLRPFADPQL